MAGDPLQTINIDQLTHAVTSVLAAAASPNVQPSTASPVVSSAPNQHSASPMSSTPVSTSTPDAINLPIPSSAPIYPVMLSMNLGGTPTILTLSDQTLAGKVTQACSTAGAVNVTPLDRITPIPAFPFPLPILSDGKCQPIPQQQLNALTLQQIQQQIQHLQQLQQLRPQMTDSPQISDRQAIVQQNATSSGQVLIRPKPSVANMASIPLLQLSQPSQPVPMAPVPVVSSQVSQQVSGHSQALTPMELQGSVISVNSYNQNQPHTLTSLDSNMISSNVPVLQLSHPLPSMPLNPTPMISTIAPSQISDHSHRLTPIDLQTIVCNIPQRSVIAINPYNHSSPSHALGTGTSQSVVGPHVGVQTMELHSNPPSGHIDLPDLSNHNVHEPPGLSNPSEPVDSSHTPRLSAMLQTPRADQERLNMPNTDTANQTPLNNVQNLMTSLGVLSPINTSTWSQPINGGDKDARGNTPTIIGPNTWSVIDFILKAHENELNLDKSTETDKSVAEGNETASPAGDISQHTESPTGQYYCVPCNSTSDKPCKVHECNYKRVVDTPITTKARMSIPHILYLHQSVINTNFAGVWTWCEVLCYTVFGPIQGELKSAEECEKEKKLNFFSWRIFSEGKTEGISVMDENKSNWMRFVKLARTPEEQNLVAYQQGRDIFFVTCKDVPVDQELLLWYSKDYAKAIGVPMKPGLAATCNSCSKAFPNVKALGQHVKYFHPDMSTRKWKCDYCGRGFNSSAKLKSHVLSHMGVKPHICHHCGKKFTEKPNLTKHLFIHTGERNFSCVTCGRGFRQKAHLQSHILVHTGERTFKCRYCDKLFARASDVKQHEYRHTKEKVFTCPHCNKVFYKLQNFKKHSKIHSGEKDYHCQKCEKSFITRYHVKRHMVTCRGTKDQDYLLEEDAEIVALNMDSTPCQAPKQLDPQPSLHLIPDKKRNKHYKKLKHKT